MSSYYIFMCLQPHFFFFFFFNDTATTEIYTLSLHDALPILFESVDISLPDEKSANMNELGLVIARRLIDVCRFFRSEEHTSELQSLRHLVCRLLLEKKKKRLSLSTSWDEFYLASRSTPLSNT